MTHNDDPNTPGVCMTVAQFEALMRIMRVRPSSKTREGLRMVLIDGVSLYDAAKTVNEENDSAIVNTGNLARELTRARSVMQDVMVLHYPAIRMPTRRKGQRAK